MLCKHCNHNSSLVCSTCGVVVDEAELQADILSEMVEVRPLSLEYYLRKEQDDIVDHAVFDKVLPFVRSSSGIILLHFISHLKGASNVAWEKGFTVPQLMTMTGIKSTGTMSEALAELSVGRRASNTRPGITGWDLVKRANQGKKSRYVDGNRWVLNLDKVLEGEQYPLFHPGGQGRYVRLHPKVIREFLPTLTPDQGIIFLFIYRLTLGRNIEKNTITINYFTGERREVEGEPAKEPHHRSGLRSRKGVRNVVRQLEEKGVIFVEEGDDPRNGKIYSLNPDTFLIVQTRALYPSDTRIVPTDTRIVPIDTRKIPPLNSLLNSTLHEPLLTKKDETPLLNPSVQPTSLTIDSVPLYENTEGITNTLSEGGFPQKRSKDDRDAILRNVLGMEISFSIKAVHKAMDEGQTTDEELDYAILHKQSDDPTSPKYGAGIYANYLTKKLDTEGNPYQLIWKNTSAKGNGLDPAPKSPPTPTYTNGNGAAPHSPTPPPNGNTNDNYYTNGNGLDPAPDPEGQFFYGAPPPSTPPPYVSRAGESWEQQRAWELAKDRLGRELSHASFDTTIRPALLERVENGNIFVISAPANPLAWIEERYKDKMLSYLRIEAGYLKAVGHDEWSLKFEVRKEANRYGG